MTKKIITNNKKEEINEVITFEQFLINNKIKDWSKKQSKR